MLPPLQSRSELDFPPFGSVLAVVGAPAWADCARPFPRSPYRCHPELSEEPVPTPSKESAFSASFGPAFGIVGAPLAAPGLCLV